MRLLFFSTHFYPFQGGLEKYLIELTTRLAKKKIKIDVVTLNTEKKKSKEKYKGINIYRLPSKYILKGTYAVPKKNNQFQKLMKEIENNKYNCVITQTRFFYTSNMGLKFAKKHNLKLIHIEHGNSFVNHPNKLVELFSFLYDMTLGKKVISNAWKVVGISKACCNFSKKMGAKSIKLIHNGVDTKKFRKVKTNLKTKLKIPKDTKIITFIGRLIHAKGVQDLLKATENIDNIKILIVGKGPYESKLKQLAKNRKEILFMGENTEKEIINVLNITDIFVNPSYAEGLPTSVLEAAAVGKPIIATNVGGTREILSDKGKGILITPNNSSTLRKNIINLLKDQKLRKSLSTCIKKSVKDFDWELSVKKFMGLLK